MESQYTAETIAVPKISYDTWVAEQITAIPIDVLDRSAWDAMLAKVPSAKDLFAGARFPKTT